MKRIRVIPSLLIQNGGLVKSVKFEGHKYVGDPINAVKIFNDKEVDEILILDISATKNNKPPVLETIKEMASEAFMPLGYGGGITTLDQIKQLVAAGVEKVVLNAAAFENPQLVTDAAQYVGSQSVVVSIDVKRDFLGRSRVYVRNGSKNTGCDPTQYAIQMERAGAGELLLNSIEKEGTFNGFDLPLIEKVCSAIKIPVVAAGGAGKLSDFVQAIQSGASAVSVGSMFVFQMPHRAVLISYPDQKELKEKVFSYL